MPLRDPVQEQAVSHYVRRLLSGVNRSPVLRAFPTRTVKRIDLARFRVAHPQAPERLIETLVQPEGRYRLVFQDYRQPDDRGAQSQALFSTLRTKLAREAQATHRETGLWMLWLAYPLLYVPHPASDHDEYLLAPLFLWPIAIEERPLLEGELFLTRGRGAPRFNRIAWQWIRRNVQFEPPEPTSPELLELSDFGHLSNLVRRCCHGFRPQFDTTLRPRIEPVPQRETLKLDRNPRLFDAGIIGLLQWENMELLADLEKLHDMEALQGPAGDFLRERERPPAVPLEIPKEIDRYLVTDTDHSQERAVWMARRSEGVVVHGPPGTGKSQVIVNIVADALARGETVLVVCQKKAALDVVASRLRREEVGLDDLFVQVDDAEGDRRRIIEVLRDQTDPGVPGDNGERVVVSEEIERLEKLFEEYATALFHVRDSHGIDYRTMLARISRIEREHGDLRPLKAISHLLKDTNAAELSRLCDTLAGAEQLFWAGDIPNNPWVDGRTDLIGDRYELQQIEADLDAVLPAARAADAWATADAVCRGQLIGDLQTIGDAAGCVAINWPKLDARAVGRPRPGMDAVSEISDTSYADVARASERLVEKQGSILRLVSPSFRRARNAIRNFIGARQWAATPTASSHLHNIAHRAADAATCEAGLEALRAWLAEPKTRGLADAVRKSEVIAPYLCRLKEYLPKLPTLLRYRATVQGLDPRGREVVSALERASGGPPTDWATVAALSAILAWLAEAETESPILRSLTPELYNSRRAQLSELVQRKRRMESQAVRRRWASRWQQVDHRWRRGLRFRGPNSRRLREIVETGRAHGLFDFRPCWLANPGTVSQIFPLQASLFDLVVFDEASQCPPEYALPALFRGRRVVVAGDGKQLPPTMFFKAAFDFDTEELEEQEERRPGDQVDLEIAAGAEDLLSLAEARLPDAHLNVHYRSLDPVLIAFSNAAFYRNRLETPRPAKPVSPDGTSALFLERVDGMYQATRTNPEEARRVVDYVSRLWSTSRALPTVGVVTFNEAQREAIEDLLDAQAARDPGFRAVYERELTRTQDGQDVGFFVKSLEAVQGDERDVILFSTTYGRREDRPFLRSFLGPINRQGGERRLNVAVTRARLWVRIFTSLPIHELASALTPGTVESRDAAGRVALQLYLAYAERISGGEKEAGEAVLKRALELAGGMADHAGPVGAEESEFEIEVRQALRDALELEIDTQVSSGAFRIDLGVRAPDRGGYILGIECDGKAYHSAPSARAYDHWRQSVLEQRGWHIHRIWSSAWRTDRGREIEKVEERVGELIRAAASGSTADP